VGQPLTIVVIGGSVTLGHGCKSDVTGRTVPRRECCWVNHFTAWVRARYPAATITVRNKALSGCNSFFQLPQLSQTLPRDQPVDIVVLDMSSNDAMAVDFSRAPGRHEGIRKHIRNVYIFFIYIYMCVCVCVYCYTTHRLRPLQPGAATCVHWGFAVDC
jgi:hypothetical protein